MKNRKWLWWTLAIVVILIALVAAGGMGYRMGMIQAARITQNTDGTSAQFPHAYQMHGFDGSSQGKLDQRHSFGSLGFDRRQNFNRFEGRRGGFFSPLFGLFHLVLLGLLIWIGYALFKKSGWQFVRATAPQSDEPETKVEVAKKKS